MSDPFDLGVLFTDHASPATGTPFQSLWSYESRVRRRSRPSSDRPREFWLHRSDPLLNTILPGTSVSLVVNLGDRWAAGRSLAATSLLPPVAVFGPFTEPQLLRVGRDVCALGVVLPSILARDLFGVPAPALLNQVVPLDSLWPRDEVWRLQDHFAHVTLTEGLTALRDELLRRLRLAAPVPSLAGAAAGLLTARRGRVAIDAMAAHYGLSRQRFARRFQEATGVPPTQTPATQAAPVVHRSVEQSTGTPAVHAPARHVSPTVHASPSSHGPATGPGTHAPATQASPRQGFSVDGPAHAGVAVARSTPQTSG